MHFALRFIGALFRRFRRDESGGPTVEFVLVFMPFIVIPLTGFELGLIMTRHAMLERGLDMAVREVRLNTGASVSETQFKTMICNAAGILPNCMDSVRLEMRPIDMRHSGVASDNEIPRVASCTDVNNPFEPARNFTNGNGNEMMVVRACGTFSPMLFSGIGVAFFLHGGTPGNNPTAPGHYRLVATTAFVMEPL